MQAASNSRYFKLFVFVSVLTVSSFFVALTDSFAITAKTQLSETTASSAFCKNFTSKTTEATTKIDSLSAKLFQAWDLQGQKNTTQHQQIDQKVDADRTLADTTRFEDFKKLEAKAITDSQKVSVQTYKSAVGVAVSARRFAYDNARKEFRANVQNDIDIRKSTVAAQLEAYKSSVNTAIASAKAGCSTDSTVSAAAIRTTFQTAMKTAQTTFKTNRAGDEKVKIKINGQVATRNAAFKTADLAFKDVMSAARQKIILAFGSKTDI